MARGFTFFVLGAALGFCGGWKGSQKVEKMRGAAKPTSIVARVAQVRDYLSGGDAEERRMKQIEENIWETKRQMAELAQGNQQMLAAIIDEVRKLAAGDQQQRDSSPPPPPPCSDRPIRS
ncbi:hypothetical protein ACP70R_035315 [Stipagrostis hirtigluma subsp. patula]